LVHPAEVSGILKKSIHGGKCLRPAAALIFDEKYNLLGHLDIQDILQYIGMSPSAGKRPVRTSSHLLMQRRRIF